MYKIALYDFFFFEISETRHSFKISNISNFQRTVANKKCKKVYTTRIIKR